MLMHQNSLVRIIHSVYIFKKIIMKLLLCLFILTLVFTSCNESQNNVFKKILNETNSVKIYFYTDQGNKRIKTLAYSTEDSVSISKLNKYISHEETPFYKCGYDGCIELQSYDGKMIEMEFNLLKECMHIVFEYGHKLFSRKISEEGYDFLTSLRKK